MQKEYRKLYYRLLQIPRNLIIRRDPFTPTRRFIPFPARRKPVLQQRPGASRFQRHRETAPRQEILIVYRDEALPGDQ